MGACDDYRVYNTDDVKAVRRQFERACAEAKVEDGVNYPGTIAAFNTISFWFDKRFNTLEEAVRDLLKNHEKYKEAEAVSFLIPAERTKEDEQRVKATKKSLDNWRDRLDSLRSDLMTTFVERKRSTVGCASCGSRFSRDHLVEKLKKRALPFCPLCDALMLSDGEKERLSKIEARVKKARAAHADAAREKPSDKVGWVVGGWCPS